jgi:serine/threonine protein kinase
MMDVGSGLAYLHSRQRVHGDIKSMNVLVTRTMLCKLTDFDAGIDMRLQGEDDNIAKAFSVPWMAIEMVTSFASASVATDVWAYGVVLWEIAAKQPPFSQSKNPKADISKRRMPAMDANWPVVWRHLMTSTWQVEPHRRPDIGEMVAQLQNALGGDDIDTDI